MYKCSPPNYLSSCGPEDVHHEYDLNLFNISFFSVTCEKCQHISSTYDPLMEVLLDIKVVVKHAL